MKSLLILIVSAAFVCVKCDLYRLPGSVKPLRYVLTIEPNLTYVGRQPSPFHGKIKIELEILENTHNITLHAVDLVIDEFSISVVGNEGEFPVKSTTKVKNDQVFTITLEKPLLKENSFYNLSIGRFEGRMDSNSRGLYKAYYSYKDEERVVAVTHFAPTFSRYAFPCFDEPHLKAKFSINLIREKAYNSIANEALQSTEFLGENLYKDVFKETPPMATYAVAFAVSDFLSTPKIERHRILAQPNAFEKNELEYPLLTSVKVLQLLEEYIGVNFPLSKMDTFAVPEGNFEHFAMENWGLITFEESQLRCPNNSRPLTLTMITSYICHKFAQQWFGNLVTHAAWDYTWLSESFSAYLQYFITAKIHPTWKIMDQFVVSIVQRSFFDEKSRGGHPLNVRISQNGQYPPFNTMYRKGSSIVRMMSHFLTEEVFRKALREYIVKHQFGNVVPGDLYKSVQETVTREGVEHLLGGMSFQEIMETWDSVKGFPILYVTRNYTNGDINITQVSKDFNNEQVWKIPINYVVSSKGVDFSKTTADLWLVEESIVLNETSVDGWVIVNKQQFGYYRVNYDYKNWDRLIDVLKSDKFQTIHVLNRAQLINDAFYFSAVNELPIEIPYRLAEYLVREKEYTVFAVFCSSLRHFTKIYYGDIRPVETEYFLNHPLNNTIVQTDENTDSRGYLIFKEYIRTILANIVAELGIEERSISTNEQKLLRSELDKYFPYYYK